MDNDSILGAVASCLNDALKPHYKEKKRAERARVKVRSAKVWQAPSPTLKGCVFEAMDDAARKASADYTLLFTPRQVYYQVRPLIQGCVDKNLEYSYFTPQLLTKYQEIYGPLPGLIYEPRGHFIEPHKNEVKCPNCNATVMEVDVSLPLGTVEVEEYEIPEYRYGKILYIEKEGFRPILNAAKLGQRHDMALMTAKGYATRAAKALLSHAEGKEVTILVAHDCDISGYQIARGIEEATRTTPGMHIKVIDLGLKVREALHMGLETEEVTIKKFPRELYSHLTSEERGFLIHTRGYTTFRGNRVELNAMSTDQLISWLEGKLKNLGLQTKVLPPEDVVEQALKDNIDSQIDKDIKQMVRQAIEQLLGITISAIETEAKEKVGAPNAAGYHEELKEFLQSCPPEYWRDWVSNKASDLENSHITDKESLVQKLVSLKIGSVIAGAKTKRKTVYDAEEDN